MVEDWITTAEAVKLSGYHIERIRELAREGLIEGRKWGREWMINEASLRLYLEKVKASGKKRGPKPTSR